MDTDFINGFEKTAGKLNIMPAVKGVFHQAKPIAKKVGVLERKGVKEGINLIKAHPEAVKAFKQQHGEHAFRNTLKAWFEKNTGAASSVKKPVSSAAQGERVWDHAKQVREYKMKMRDPRYNKPGI